MEMKMYGINGMKYYQKSKGLMKGSLYFVIRAKAPFLRVKYSNHSYLIPHVIP